MLKKLSFYSWTYSISSFMTSWRVEWSPFTELVRNTLELLAMQVLF